MIKNFFNFSAAEAVRGQKALVACLPKEGATALLVFRRSDGGVDDPHLTGEEEFFPLEMILEKKGGARYLEGGDWTVIPYVRQRTADYEGRYRSYMLVEPVSTGIWVCANCGDTQSEHPDYGVRDLDTVGAPIIGGNGGCGDLHQWVEVVI